jgi:hypothetical protein
MSFSKEHARLAGSLKRLSSQRNRWIAGVFACYVMFVFVFAVVYYQFYQHDRRTFAFSSDIARVQMTATEAETQEQLAKLSSELADLRELQGELRSMQAAPIVNLENRKQELQNRIERFKAGSPDVWSFWDFFYFSAITQFTVGYGDILPNATSVRLVVVLQTFVAALLLVVVLNLTFRN